MKPDSGLKLTQIIPRLVRVSDLLAMAALFGSQEVSMLMLAPLVVMAILSYVAGYFQSKNQQRVLNALLFATLTSVVIVALVMVLKTRLYPLIIATYTTMVVHGLMWFLPSTNRTRSVRMLVGLVEVAVAAVLTPEMYIALVIFCFVVIVAIEVSLMFLQDQLFKFDPQKAVQPLPKGFLFHSLSVSVVVFLLSLLIFPILPRARTNLGSGWTQEQKTRVGYTEQVNLGVLPSWTGSSAEKATALRIFLPSEVSASMWQMRFPMGLLRSRVLDRFDENRWIPDTRNGLELETRATQELGNRKDPVRIEVIREPIESNFLPTPYGARSVELGTGTREHNVHRSTTGTWFVPGTERNRMQYYITEVFGERLSDPPAKIHTEVPKDWIGSSPRWLELRDKIFRGATTAKSKVDRLDAFFKREGYTAANENPLGDVSGLNPLAPALKDPRRQVDVFLFSIKRGHCEYFASAAAMLLRLAGVPTRLVAGFRLSSGPVGDVITVHQGDGHAWVEVWIPERGWVPYDPTPKLMKQAARFWDTIALAQDYLSAYWYRYVLSFDQAEQVDRGMSRARSMWKDFRPSHVIAPKWSGQKAVDWLLPIVVLALLGVTFVALRFGFRLSMILGSNAGQIHWTLFWRLYRANRWFRSTTGLELRAPQRMGIQTPSFEAWYSVTDRLRFGPVALGSEEWRHSLREMDRLWPRVQNEVKSSRTAA